MTAREPAAPSGRARRALFVQATEPAGYPPLIHAATLMADAGWEVTFLAAPILGKSLRLPEHPRIQVQAIRARPSHIMNKAAYAAYVLAAARLAIRLRPQVVYASDPPGAGPGLAAAQISLARLIYHEHDSPSPGALHPWLARMRTAAARRAAIVVFPNEARARIAQREIGFSEDRLHVVWNMPRRSEVPLPAGSKREPLVFYYHGNISPTLLPEILIGAIGQLWPRACLQIAGYEAPEAAGYIQECRRFSGGCAIAYFGEMSRDKLLGLAAKAHVGLALMPPASRDLNLNHMAGASNKAFDYMAAGLALLVSDLPDWRDMFVTPGYGLACNPCDSKSIALALRWFLDHPQETQAMAARGRAKIETDWNYDRAFAPVLAELSHG